MINCNNNSQDIKTCNIVKIEINTSAVFLLFFPNIAANCIATNVDNVSTLREIKSVELYSISGQRVTESVKGFVIKKTFYKDGSSSTEKTILNK